MHDDDVSNIRLCNILKIKMSEQSKLFVSGFRLLNVKKCYRITHTCPWHCSCQEYILIIIMEA